LYFSEAPERDLYYSTKNDFEIILFDKIIRQPGN
jgi:hypothetical protein